LAAIETWNGRYDLDSKGAVAFEAAMKGFVPTAFAEHEVVALEAGGSKYKGLAARIPALDAAKFAVARDAALKTAAEAMAKYPAWGDMHRIMVQGPFAAIPVIGSRYVFDDVAAAGSSQTLLKTDHETTAERHPTRYGAQARHVSDLANPDANWFVLFGGNDGWYNAENFRDQVEAFQAGRSFQVPLKIETVRATFKHKTQLTRK
jgi:penicillin amidase